MTPARALVFAGAAVVCVAVAVTRFTDGEDSVTPVAGPAGLGLVLAGAVVHAYALITAVPAARVSPVVGATRLASERVFRVRMAIALSLAVGVPLVGTIAAVIVVEDGWVLVGVFLVFALAGLTIEQTAERRRWQSEEAPGPLLLAIDRLSMRADLPSPQLRIEDEPVATAWTSGGCVHVTTGLLDLLDEDEMNAVLAHELVHLARRDAPVMEIASAPSRVLLAAATVLLHPGRSSEFRELGERIGAAVFGVIFVPPALLLGWLSRLLVLDFSRSREFVADAGAAGLTGSPSALASALLKLEEPRRRIPREDLRLVHARGVLCFAPVRPMRGSRFLHTHPSLGERILRLDEMERRLQATR